MSWGGTVAGVYTAGANEKVVKLALIAPQWLKRGTVTIDQGGPLGAYCRVPVADVRDRWLAAALVAKRQDFIPPGWFDMWAEATLATDPMSNATSPPAVRAPNGPIQDVRDYWAAERPYYDPAASSFLSSWCMRSGT